MNEPHTNPPALSRREMLCRCGTGFGALALVDLLSQTGFLSSAAQAAQVGPAINRRIRCWSGRHRCRPRPSE